MRKFKLSLEEKIKEALSRTKQFANGIAVKFPDESCQFLDKSKIDFVLDEGEITNFGWGGKRVKGQKMGF